MNEMVLMIIVVLSVGFVGVSIYALWLLKSRQNPSGELIKAQQENSFLKNDIAKIQTMLDSANNALESEKSQNAESQKQLAVCNEKIALLEKSLAEKDNMLIGTQKVLGDEQSKILSIEKELSGSKERVASLEESLAEKATLSEELKSEQAKRLEVEKELSTLEEKIVLLEQSIREKDDALMETNKKHKQDLEDLEEKYNRRQKELKDEYSQTLKEERDNSQNTLKTMKNEYQENLKTLESKLKEHYANTNKAILDQNQLMLNKDSKKILDEIFVPIKKSIDEYSKNLSDNEIKLKTNIDNMFKYSQQIKQDADQFAKILKGDKKIRGDFGELQLKSVLESSGLLEGEHYFLQEDFTHNDDNHARAKHYRPDAIVRLDKNRSIVIDAKFSLPNMDFSEFGENEISEMGKIELAKNLKSRIDELAKKPYSAQGSDTYDYVLLFIPYQNILDLVLSVDSGIYKYAEDKKIYLATPHTLFMALKTISITWRHIQSDQNIQSAFE